MKGWFKVDRKLAESSIWLSEPFTRGQAWVDLLMLTNHAPNFIIKAGKKINIERGQCGWSLLELSKRWGWSRGKTKRFVSLLVSEGMIKEKTDTHTTIITVCNYLQYQDGETTDSATGSTPDGHQTDTRRYTKKNDKNDKNEINIPDFIDGEIWLSWIKHRKEIKKKLTKTQSETQIKKLTNWHNAGHNVNEIIQQSIANGWQGLFEPKGNMMQKGSVNDELQQFLDR